MSSAQAHLRSQISTSLMVLVTQATSTSDRFHQLTRWCLSLCSLHASYPHICASVCRWYTGNWEWPSLYTPSSYFVCGTLLHQGSLWSSLFPWNRSNTHATGNAFDAAQIHQRSLTQDEHDRCQTRLHSSRCLSKAHTLRRKTFAWWISVSFSCW